MNSLKIGSGVVATLTLLIATSVTRNVAAQGMASAPPAPAYTMPPILSVSMPPRARLRLDLDTRDDDILGVVKSYFRGFNGQSLKGLLSSIGIPAPAPGTVPPAGGTPPHPPFDLDKAAALQLMSESDMATLLRDVHHLRVVVFETARTKPTPHNKKRTDGKPTPPKPAPQSVISYYEQAYLTREGGRRIMRGDFDGVQVLTVGFQPGFAVVVQSPGMGVVVRADGYPNFEGAGPLAMAMMLRFAPNAYKPSTPCCD